MSSWAPPDLQSLVDLFFSDPNELGVFNEVTAANVPEPYRRLLNHSSHMTVTLEEFHHCKVEVDVMQRRNDNSYYSRKILLRRETDKAIVQFGLVRLNTQYLDDHIRDEIVSETIPLGRVLINNNVLRHVKLLSLWEITPGPFLIDHLGAAAHEKKYARTALIYCNGVPGVELLEMIV
jgi:chorismate-pyruvate lyase